MSVSVLNTDSGLSGKTIDLLESDQTITGAKTFDRDPSAPFVVTASSAVVTNLDADKVDGQHGSYYNDPANLSSAVPVTKGGTAAAILTNHGVLIGQGTSAVVATAVGTTGQVLTGVTGADPVFSTLPGVLSLLKSSSGTDTAAGATTVDSIATGALTAKDRLLVYVTVEEATQLVARVDLYSVTDATICARLTAAGTVGSGVTLSSYVVLSQGQTGATKYIARVESGTTGGDASETSNNTLATNWTTGFTIGLRHGGVTAGGTFAYSWSVYKLAGQ